MKLKSNPNDFVVEERTDVVPSTGRFAFYRLDKRNLTTLDAIATIKKRWHVRPDNISFGGLKDRHAATSQFLTIFRGPPRDLSDRGVELHFLGHVGHRYSADDIRGNFFQIIMRDLTKVAAVHAASTAIEVSQTGFPNYFDDQRFGSFAGGEFIARLMVLGRYEEALRLALTAPYEHDNAAAKRDKQQLRKLWGFWDELLPHITSKQALDVVAYLQQSPTDFRGAVVRLWPESHGLYLAAYQSHIWNRMLADLIRQTVGSENCAIMSLKTDDVPAPRRLSRGEREQLSHLELPLPSARLRFDPEAIWARLITTALGDQGFELHEMKLPGLRKPFFSKGDRAAWIIPRDVSAQYRDDERHSGKFKLSLSFELPRGSYATIFTKRVLQAK